MDRTSLWMVARVFFASMLLGALVGTMIRCGADGKPGHYKTTTSTSVSSSTLPVGWPTLDGRALPLP